MKGRKFTKSAKPTNEVLKSQIYQAIKQISKEVKTEKTLLVLKRKKKLVALHKSSSSSEEDSVLEDILANDAALNELKGLDQSAVAKEIVRQKVSFGSDPMYNPPSKTLDCAIDIVLLKTIMHQ